MKKLSMIIVAFLLISFIVISTAGEKETFEGKNVVTIEMIDADEMYIPIEDFVYKNGNYTYVDGNKIYSINEYFISKDAEVIHLVSR